MNAIGISTRIFSQSKHDVDSILSIIAEKADAIEIWAEHPTAHFWQIMQDEARADELARKLKSRNLLVSVHAPFHDINIGTPDPYLHKIFISEMEKAIDATARIGGDIMVIHAGRNKIGDKNAVILNAIESLNHLVKYAENRKVTLCLENDAHSRVNVAIFKEDVSHLLNKVKNLKLALDIGHLGTIRNIDYASYIKALKKYIAHVHVSDIIRNQHFHLPLGFGDVDFEACLATLKKVKYKGRFIIEGRLKQQTVNFLDGELNSFRTYLNMWFR
jgi:sugar phosphate isomerase/epimerase